MMKQLLALLVLLVVAVACGTPQPSVPEPVQEAAIEYETPVEEEVEEEDVEEVAEVPEVVEETPIKAAPAPSVGKTHDVTIQNFAFSPAELRVKVGDTVRWTNQDSVKHSSKAADGSWNTGLLGKGESGSKTFDKAGAFEYACGPHPSIKGRIIVE